MKSSDNGRIVHPFGPVMDESSKILILGSFPSVKSREQSFFYGHPHNRFWRVLAGVLGCGVPQTIEVKPTCCFVTILRCGTCCKAVKSLARPMRRLKTLCRMIWTVS